MSESRHGEVDGGRAPAPSGPLASFARFVLCGGGVSLLASAAVPEVAEVLPWTLANALITVVSTLLCTELHSLVTFRTGRAAGLRRHLQSAGSASASYAVTTVAVLVLHAVQPTAGRLLEQAVYLGAAGLAGIGRFVVLRLFVFADGTERKEPRAGLRPLDRVRSRSRSSAVSTIKGARSAVSSITSIGISGTGTSGVGGSSVSAACLH